MKPLHVLVVEDDPTSCQIAEVVLMAEGHTVTTARNGAEALAYCHERGWKFDVILMDMLMPVMDGLEASRRLKADPRTKDTPLLCVSAGATQAEQAAGRLAGCDYYLTKPYRRSQLIEALEAVMAKPQKGE